MAPHRLIQVAPTVTLCNHKRWSNDRLTVHTRTRKEKERDGEENGEMRRVNTEEKGVGQMEGKKERNEVTKAAVICKPPTSPPTSDNEHKQGDSEHLRR
jgi:hypothetical protein